MREITGAGHYGFLIEVTAKKIKQSLQKQFNEHKIDLTVDQWVTLDQIKKSDGISQNVLAEKIFKDAPTVTRIVDILCHKDFIERRSDKRDRRRFALFLKPKGQEMINEALPVVVKTRKNGWKGLSGPDYQELVRIIRLINDNFGNGSIFENGWDQD